MRISTRGRYGLRAMIDLARNGNHRPLLMQAIADRQRIPRKYLHSLLTSLRHQGLVRSVRGSRGGYSLARDPGEISAREIVCALEGEVCLVECRENDCPGKMYADCPTRPLWEKLSALIDDHLAQTTLAHLAGDGRQPTTQDSQGSRGDDAADLPRS